MSDPMDRFISILKGEKPLDWLHPAEFEQIGEELNRLRAENVRLNQELETSNMLVKGLEGNIGALEGQDPCDECGVDTVKLLDERDQLKARVAELDGLLEWMIKIGRDHGSKCICLRCEKSRDALTKAKSLIEK